MVTTAWNTGQLAALESAIARKSLCERLRQNGATASALLEEVDSSHHRNGGKNKPSIFPAANPTHAFPRSGDRIVAIFSLPSSAPLTTVVW